MGLKKYEIITVGSDKRVRALRSWQVGDRYVNIGDVGGIVYDEKTLSQDGLCWLFRGNFGFPGARIGGDSIVDVGEAALSTTGTPNVDILGSSVVVGSSKLRLVSEQTAADAVVLTADDFEQGSYGALIAGAPLVKTDSPIYVRLKNPFFAGGKTVALKCGVPGYTITTITIDRDGAIITNSPTTSSGEGVTITVPAGQYLTFRMSKDPISVITPAEATAAQITFTGTYETKLSIIDSRVEINPATSTGTTIIKPGGTHTFSSGNKYPEAIIRNSKVSINVPAVVDRVIRILGQIIGSTATLDVTAGEVVIAGLYSNIKNLTASGIITSNLGVASYSIIQATDCDNFAVSSTIFPGLAAAQTANMPFIFQGCNVPNGIFYHHAQIKNTYVNIDFAKAQADLGKTTASTAVAVVSSEVEGVYRLYSASGFGALVESHDSVRSVTLSNIANSYGTTIYKDAYVSGEFDFAGTNVFGNKVRSHPLAQVLNVQPRAVQGSLTLTVGQRPTLVPNSLARVVIDRPIRINTANGITVNNIPAGIQAAFACVDGQGNYVVISTWKADVATVTNLAQLALPAAYIMFKKTDDSSITVDEIAGVTVTVYNGCKIVNTGETAIPMKGNIRVEDNATLINASVTGTGYFGGNAVMSGVIIGGCVYMKDNASFTKTTGSAAIRNLQMTENAKAVVGDIPVLGKLELHDNSIFMPTSFGNAEADITMYDDTVITSSLSLGGMLTLKGKAKVSTGLLFAIGDITLCGSYNQTAARSWTGKRVVFAETEPTYDNNVKTQYDF